MQRREFITLVGGAAAAWPLSARAQPSKKRRVGVFLFFRQDDSEGKSYTAAFEKSMAALGWTSNAVQFDYRWTGGDAGLVRQYAAELVGLAPDVILVAGGSHVGPLLQLTHSVPIVFVQVADAVGGGFVKSLARPGGNATGFTNFEFEISGKWLELLKQIAPQITKVAVLRDPTNPSGTGQFGAIQALASSVGVEASPLNLRDAVGIEADIAEFAQRPGGGLIVTPNSLAIVHRQLIITLADRHRLPAIYPFRYFVNSGGLISYGPDVIDQYRRAAGYVDRILKGEKSADLPVEQSTKLTMTLNMKTARTLGLTIPPAMLSEADEVIE
jgi:putative tryptophan/tyrosine transport system substrate-binding protein